LLEQQPLDQLIARAALRTVGLMQAQQQGT
jgi:hypothetical protein